MRSLLPLSMLLLCQSCIYSISGNLDAGLGHIGDETYTLQRTGITFGGHIVKVPLGLDLRINRERGQSSGDDLLRKDFYQSFSNFGVSAWLPSDSGFDPYIRYAFLQNEFEGFRNPHTDTQATSQLNEISIGVRQARVRAGDGSCFYRYGYTLEAFGSRSQFDSYPQLNTFGLRVTAFWDSGNHVSLPFMGGAFWNTCVE